MCLEVREEVIVLLGLANLGNFDLEKDLAYLQLAEIGIGCTSVVLVCSHIIPQWKEREFPAPNKKRERKNYKGAVEPDRGNKGGVCRPPYIRDRLSKMRQLTCHSFNGQPQDVWS